MSIPNVSYFGGLLSFNDGDFKSAGAGDVREARRAASAAPRGDWIDSICFHHDRSALPDGDMGSAYDQYVRRRQTRHLTGTGCCAVRFPPPSNPEQNIKNQVTWGISQRRTKIGHLPAHFQIMQGKTMAENAAAAQNGGVIVPQELYTCYVGEIVRCTALAISRRAEILGPASQHDSLTTQTLQAFRAGRAANAGRGMGFLHNGYGVAGKPEGPRATNSCKRHLRSSPIGGTHRARGWRSAAEV
jgi:hypothetical protein